MEIRPHYLALSAITAGFLAAWLIHTIGVSETVRLVHTGADQVRPAVLSKSIDRQPSVAPSLSRSASATTINSATRVNAVLLAEPMVILHGNATPTVAWNFRLGPTSMS